MGDAGVGARPRERAGAAAQRARHAPDHVALRDPAAARASGRAGRRGQRRTAEYNATHYRENVFYDLAKTGVNRLAWGQAQELGPHGATAVALTPGWLRSEMMPDAFGVTEANWRDATKVQPHFCVSESPVYVGRA